MSEIDASDRLVKVFRRQAASAVQRSSPLYQELLRGCLSDLRTGGPVWRLLRPHAGDPAGSAVPLRLLAAVHLLVLQGRCPQLAPFYPSVGGQHPPEEVWPHFASVLQHHSPALAPLLRRPLQTNEVRRCSALLAGFAWIAARTGLPLAVLEIGASAGLNLNWWHYRYTGEHGSWGPASSVELPLPDQSTADLAALGPPVETVGCDLHPLDPRDPSDRLWLRACVWADHTDRLMTLEAAFAVAEQHPPCQVEREDAAEWLDQRLRRRSTDQVTVVVQTIVDQYLSRPQRRALRTIVGRAGAETDRRRPLAWLRLEPPAEDTVSVESVRGLAELRVHEWPSGTEHLLGWAGFHGTPVRLIDPRAGVAASQ